MTMHSARPYPVWSILQLWPMALALWAGFMVHRREWQRRVCSRNELARFSSGIAKDIVSFAAVSIAAPDVEHPVTPAEFGERLSTDTGANETCQIGKLEERLSCLGQKVSLQAEEITILKQRLERLRAPRAFSD